MLVLKIVIIIICVIVAAFIVAGIYAGHFASDNRIDMMKFIKKQLDPSDSANNENMADCAGDLRERVDQEYDLTNREGLRLHGYLVKGDPASDVYIFYSHGYRDPYGGMEAGDKMALWKDRGYHLFTVDHRAHANSAGRFISFGQHEADDCIEWLELMKKEFGENIRIILYGTSMGAATVMQMAGRETLPDNVKLIIEDCGYTDFYAEASSLFEKLPAVIKKPWMCATNTYLRLFHHIDMRKADSLGAVKKMTLPILFLHGQKDTFVPVRMCGEVYEACASPHKQMEIFPEGTHATSYFHDPERYAGIVHEFIDRYITS